MVSEKRSRIILAGAQELDPLLSEHDSVWATNWPVLYMYTSKDCSRAGNNAKLFEFARALREVSLESVERRSDSSGGLRIAPNDSGPKRHPVRPSSDRLFALAVGPMGGLQPREVDSYEISL